MRYTVIAFAYEDNWQAQAMFNSLSLATQWAKQSAELEGRMWDFRVRDNHTDKIVAIVYHNGVIDTPHGVALYD